MRFRARSKSDEALRPVQKGSMLSSYQKFKKNQKLDAREEHKKIYAAEVYKKVYDAEVYKKQYEAGELEKLGEWRKLTGIGVVLHIEGDNSHSL